ncbi:MAG TPA: hypothetical protein VMM78_13760, partial [Thermomicrobiales bacterium]|nr:hypothetical protein [Thermomicrobiales bacterium]
MLVDNGWIGSARRLDKRTRRIRAGVLQRDRDQLEVSGLALLVESLPPGQLLPAASPRAPHVQQQSF